MGFENSSGQPVTFDVAAPARLAAAAATTAPTAQLTDPGGRRRHGRRQRGRHGTAAGTSTTAPGLETDSSTPTSTTSTSPTPRPRAPTSTTPRSSPRARRSSRRHRHHRHGHPVGSDPGGDDHHWPRARSPSRWCSTAPTTRYGATAPRRRRWKRSTRATPTTERPTRCSPRRPAATGLHPLRTPARLLDGQRPGRSTRSPTWPRSSCSMQRRSRAESATRICCTTRST